MKNVASLARALSCLLPWAICLLVSGCESPLVGLSCQAGYTRCDHACVDLKTHEDHCGACGTLCASGQMCVAGACIDDNLDGGTRRDGGTGGNDAEIPPLCSGSGSPEECVCDVGQLKCGSDCVNAVNDPGHCGDCDIRCPQGAFCVEGVCRADCTAPLTECNAQCVDLTKNASTCGSCSRGCESGLCVQGECLGTTVGHVIVIGHDLGNANTPIRRILGNAVFLPNADPVNIVLYDERTAPAAKAGVESAIEAMAMSTGRAYKMTSASPLAVTFLLGTADVFVIAAQTDARDSSLIKNGMNWARALRSFVARGGVVVLLDGGGSNAGTYQILQAAGLFDARSRTLLDGPALTLVTPGDAVASYVPTMYSGAVETVGFDTDEERVVVADPKTGLPVVIHVTR